MRGAGLVDALDEAEALVSQAQQVLGQLEGGRPLSGTVRASGNKNGALPILAATVLASEEVRLSNVPRIRDVETMIVHWISSPASPSENTAISGPRRELVQPIEAAVPAAACYFL